MGHFQAAAGCGEQYFEDEKDEKGTPGDLNWGGQGPRLRCARVQSSPPSRENTMKTQSGVKGNSLCKVQKNFPPLANDRNW